jgi:hypothetical protein
MVSARSAVTLPERTEISFVKLSIRNFAVSAGLVLALAVAAPAALASGGAGGGGTGGGGGGGGAKVVVPPPAPTAPGAPCATLNVSAPVGYYAIWAALWNEYTVKSCSTGGPQTYWVRLVNTDTATGLVAYDVTTPHSLSAGQNVRNVLDNDVALFSTTYSVDVSVSDGAGNVIASRSIAATTPPQR